MSAPGENGSNHRDPYEQHGRYGHQPVDVSEGLIAARDAMTAAGWEVRHHVMDRG